MSYPFLLHPVPYVCVSHSIYQPCSNTHFFILLTLFYLRPVSLSSLLLLFFFLLAAAQISSTPPLLSKQPKTDQLYPPAHWGQATLPFRCLASPLAPQGPWSVLHAIHPGKPARPARGEGLKFENHHHLPDSTPGGNRSP